LRSRCPDAKVMKQSICHKVRCSCGFSTRL
ncbi:hypothetical protein PANDA_011187, partial [Ailuropoda melanoleuca]